VTSAERPSVAAQNEKFPIVIGFSSQITIEGNNLWTYPVSVDSL
jgi:hypothetical protein